MRPRFRAASGRARQEASWRASSVIIFGVAAIAIGFSGRDEVNSNVAPINSGDRAKCFASYMRIHTLEATR